MRIRPVTAPDSQWTAGRRCRGGATVGAGCSLTALAVLVSLAFTLGTRVGEAAEAEGSAPGAPAAAADETGFVPLLSAEVLKDWRQAGSGRFAVTNGVATGEGGPGVWWYAGRMFTNFLLRGEFLQEKANANSGVFLRFRDPGNDPGAAVQKGLGMEIGDPQAADATLRTGAIRGVAAPSAANTKPAGQWNTFEIVCYGHSYAVRINGEMVTRWIDPQRRAAAGYIGLQNGAGGQAVRFRDLRIKPLSSPQLPPMGGGKSAGKK